MLGVIVPVPVYGCEGLQTGLALCHRSVFEDLRRRCCALLSLPRESSCQKLPVLLPSIQVSPHLFRGPSLPVRRILDPPPLPEGIPEQPVIMARHGTLPPVRNAQREERIVARLRSGHEWRRA